jgi:hypothetical protein
MTIARFLPGKRRLRFWITFPHGPVMATVTGKQNPVKRLTPSSL